ncbi:hypothetical protein ABFX02_07G078700 [Erythranthe guttata]
MTILSLILLLTISILIQFANSTTHWGDVQVLKQLKSTITQGSVPPSCIDSWDFC